MNELASQDHISRRARLGMPVAPQARVKRSLIVRDVKPAMAMTVATSRWRTPDPVFNFLTTPGPVSIIRLVSMKHGLRYYDVIGTCRQRSYMAARREAVLMLLTHCPKLSYPAIGRLFHRDHSTILYLIGKHKRGGHNDGVIHANPRYSQPPLTLASSELAQGFEAAQTGTVERGSC